MKSRRSKTWRGRELATEPGTSEFSLCRPAPRTHLHGRPAVHDSSRSAALLPPGQLRTARQERGDFTPHVKTESSQKPKNYRV
ncbi:hypothetical protein NDU88_007033 [Pleurodeles waltl]|uniref:Uncharacterized protein n=1 Tax=Pleurodeles waltl TaxID=8319 RepID=A0AAV7VQY6_PLEWA|nr:hypothetical protein NDU88_007033 [Pleurodeles waltl]